MEKEDIKKNDEFGLENVKSVESDVAENADNGNDEGSESPEGTQQIKTKEKETVRKENGEEREVLVGDDLEDVKKIKEGFSTDKRKLLNKLLK